MKQFRLILLVLICCSFGTTAVVMGQPLNVDFRQAANNDSPYSLGDVHWIGSILQASNSVYYEGMSVAQRVMFLNIPATTGNVHTLTFSHQASKGGIHAYDYLTSYDQAIPAAAAIVSGSSILSSMNPCGPEMGPPASMSATCATIHGGLNTLLVDVPDAMGTLLGHNIATSITNYEARFGNRQVKLYGDAPFSGGSLVFNGYTVGSDQYAEYTLTWTSASSSVLIEFAGHLSLSLDVNGAGSGIGYGLGTGASSISGGPYHFKLSYLDNNSLGSQDNQIKGADILINIPCDVSGPTPVCAGTQNTYTYNTSATGLTYSWALTNNTSGATFAGPTNGQSVMVNSGTLQGGYTVEVSVSNALQTVTCPFNVTVYKVSLSETHTNVSCNGAADLRRHHAIFICME